MGTASGNKLIAGDGVAFATDIEAAKLGLSLKTSGRAATIIPGTLATSFANGEIIDGVTLVTGNRILVKDQADPEDNGIYVVKASGAPDRATDMVLGAGYVPNAYMFVQEGSLADTSWVMTNNAPIEIGVTELVFTQFGAKGADGTDGDPGVDGKTVLNGTAVPTSEGVLGDFYLKTDTMEMYGPKSGGGWGSPTLLIGADGEDGAPGEDAHTVGTAQYQMLVSGADPFTYVDTLISALAGSGLAAAAGVLSISDFDLGSFTA
jgi:hypothetical protein